MNGHLEIRERLASLQDAERALRASLPELANDPDGRLAALEELDAVRRERDQLKVEYSNHDFVGGPAHIPEFDELGISGDDGDYRENLEDLFLDIEEIMQGYDSEDDGGFGSGDYMPDNVFEIGDPPSTPPQESDRGELDALLERAGQSGSATTPETENRSDEQPQSPIEISGDSVIELMDVVPPLEDEDIDEWLAELGYRWRTIDFRSAVKLPRPDARDLIQLGREIGNGTRVTNIPAWLPDTLLRYIELGIEQTANRSNEDYRSILPRRGYYDEFGFHRSFCMSCHDPTNPAAELKRSAAYAGNEWEIFWMGVAADFIPMTPGTRVPRSLGQLARGLRLGMRQMQMRAINMSERLIQSIERAMMRSMPAPYKRAMMRGMVMPHVEIFTIGTRAIPRAFTGRGRRYVYRLLKDGDPVYYGITNNPRARVLEHAQTKGTSFDTMEVMTDLLRTSDAAGLESGLVWRHLSEVPAERFLRLSPEDARRPDLVLKVAGLLNDKIPGGRRIPSQSWSARQHLFVPLGDRVRIRNPLYDNPLDSVLRARPRRQR